MSLYQRFCQLDRSAKGFISADEFLSVPEFAMNPLSQVQKFVFTIQLCGNFEPKILVCDWLYGDGN